MATPHYIYIDDEKEDSIISLVHGLNDTKEIDVKIFKITHDETFDSLTKKIQLSVKDNDANGILIDLCLNGEGENHLNFTAAPVAQHIRSLASDGQLPSLPIVLCSTDEKLKKTYNTDKVSHDLYDYKFVKGNDIKWDKVRRKMAVLVQDYPILYKKNLSEIINLSEEEIQDLDSRIFDRFITDKSHVEHEYAHFIIKDMFQHPGILINEKSLAARLGVDTEKSQDWVHLLEILDSNLRYKGVFSKGWKRFWSHRLNILFQEISEGNSWVSLNAEERVNILIKQYGLKKIQAAKPLKFASSSYFDTICEYTKMPLDSMEGYEIFESYELRPWQAPKYISFYGIAKDTYHDIITIKERELNRFKINRENIQNESESNK